MSLLHFLQAMAVYFISDPEKGVVPITVNYLKFDPALQKLLPATEQIGEVNLLGL